ncbi:RNA polymerase sigma factor [Thermodesulfobacteriota bacterium]
MKTYTDIELVDLANGGNARALEHLFDKYYMTVYSLAYKWSGVKEDAEDIAQDVFVKLVRKLHTFGQKSSFKTWLYRIVINTAKDFSRKRAGKQAYESDVEPEAGGHNPVGSAKDTLETARLFAAIDRLPLKQKEAILLVFGEGLSHKGAARALGCAETTISWRIFQARKGLKKSLERET